MKNVFILFFLSLINFTALAQRNFYKLNIGVGAGYTFAHTDYDKVKKEFARNVLLDYYLTPYSSFGVEVQSGNLKSDESSPQSFDNKYFSVFGNGKVHFGEFLPFSYGQSSLEKTLKGVYLGAGLGFIKNEVTQINKDNSPQKSVLPAFKEIIIPLNIGIDIHLSDANAENKFSINLNAQTTFALGDNLDGEFTPSNTENDWYNFFSIGLRYSFGFKGYYRKGWPR